MLAMCPGVNERDFRSGQRSGTYGKDTVNIGDIKTMRQARTLLWKDLHEFKIKACRYTKTKGLKCLLVLSKNRGTRNRCN